MTDVPKPQPTLPPPPKGIGLPESDVNLMQPEFIKGTKKKSTKKKTTGKIADTRVKDQSSETLLPAQKGLYDKFSGKSINILFTDQVTNKTYLLVDTYDPSTGAKIIQALDPENPDIDKPALKGAVYIGRNKKGKYFIGDKSEATSSYIQSLTNSEFAGVRDEMMRRGYRGVTSSTDKNSDVFYSAVFDLLEIQNRYNFDELSIKTDSNGKVQFNKLDEKKLQFIPGNMLVSTPVDYAYVSAKSRAATDLKAIAYANGIKYDDATIEGWANQVATSGGSIDDFAKRIRLAAATAFPNFKDQLNAGANLSDIASAYIQTASELLELPRDSFDLSKPGDVVRKALTSKNDKGVLEPMGMTDFETMIKQDPRWMQTKNATNTFTSLYENFSRMLGVGSHGAY